ncbi:hypothetical protein HHK36_026559 [Tetracentron sinense]|uniref:Glutaredoxin domain-containing protein n=1 Tax=Tetracentron sinense TaxID=13715 RepID=A0A834YFP0_TETSI|nr:hypothetical protein HHK36_026559 [Tetracentron sinense]
MAQRVMMLGSQKPVVIFSRSNRCMCHTIKTLFTELGAYPFVHDQLDEDPNGGDIERALLTMGLNPAVPAVFIGGKLVGGAGDVMTLQLNGSLRRWLLRAYVWVWSWNECKVKYWVTWPTEEMRRDVESGVGAASEGDEPTTVVSRRDEDEGKARGSVGRPEDAYINRSAWELKFLTAKPLSVSTTHIAFFFPNFDPILRRLCRKILFSNPSYGDSDEIGISKSGGDLQ